MAIAVTNIVVAETADLYCVHLTGIADGAGEESAVVKVDRSTLISPAGIEPGALEILAARWNVKGFTYVKLAFDHTTDDTAMVLVDQGFDDFTNGPKPLATGIVGRLRDPGSAGGTGDLVLTTLGAAAGTAYDITLWLRKAR
jgi:hypothetical protein